MTSLGVVSGLAAGAQIIGLDSRPAVTGRRSLNSIFAITDQNRLYQIRFGGNNPTAIQVGLEGVLTGEHEYRF